MVPGLYVWRWITEFLPEFPIGPRGVFDQSIDRISLPISRRPRANHMRHFSLGAHLCHTPIVRWTHGVSRPRVPYRTKVRLLEAPQKLMHEGIQPRGRKDSGRIVGNSYLGITSRRPSA